MLQQYLPFTVLKLQYLYAGSNDSLYVATVLTVYGIETHEGTFVDLIDVLLVATVLTVYGIETEY